MENIPIPKLPWNIYWINLDRRPDRKQHMERLLINNQENSFRIQAVDYKNNFYPYNVIKHPKLKDGEHGCTSSHIKALSYFLENTSDEFCFIAEDDLSNKYSAYWQEKHFEYLKTGSYEILQLQTTTDCFNSNELIPENKYGAGSTFYKIHRKIAQKIVNGHFNKETLTVDFTSHNHPVADLFIWGFGDTYLLPMFTYVDVKDSDTCDDNKNLNDSWLKFFKNAKDKYLYMWQNLPKETVP